jgi:hypothetical protein
LENKKSQPCRQNIDALKTKCFGLINQNVGTENPTAIGTTTSYSCREVSALNYATRAKFYSIFSKKITTKNPIQINE